MIKHFRHLRTFKKSRKHSPTPRIFYIFFVFSNGCRVLLQSNTRLRLLYLLNSSSGVNKYFCTNDVVWCHHKWCHVHFGVIYYPFPVNSQWWKLHGKRQIKIELCVKLSLLRLFHVDHVVQNRWTALSPSWQEWFSCKGKEWKIYFCELALSSEPQIWKFHVVVQQTTSKHCTKTRAACAARLFFFIQSIKSLICGVVVDVAAVKS